MKATTAPQLAGVMGWPISHSLSPALHGYWIANFKLHAAYRPLPVRPENLAAALRGLAQLGYRGANLTIPHKEAAMEYMDDIDDTAQRIGAINTVIVDHDGRLIGRNTDAIGFTSSLIDAGLLRPQALETAIILGAGGAARAIIAALIDFGYGRIQLFNRTADRAQALANNVKAWASVPIEVAHWGKWETMAADAALLVNTTALGMTGQPRLEIDLAGLAPHCMVVDIVYRPLRTDLLASAQARGLRTADGLGMLMHQAVPAFKAWFGIEPKVTTSLRTHLLQFLG